MAPQTQMPDDFSFLTERSQPVKLNVGGTKYETTLERLSSFPKISTIAYELWLEDPESEVFIDRNGLRFAYCLDFVRDGEVAIPSNISVESVIRDLEYYEVPNIDHGSIKNINISHSLPQTVTSIAAMSKKLGEDIRIASRKHTFLLFIKAFVRYIFTEKRIHFFDTDTPKLRIKHETWDYLFHQAEHVYAHLSKAPDGSKILSDCFNEHCCLRFKNLCRNENENEAYFTLSFE